MPRLTKQQLLERRAAIVADAEVARAKYEKKRPKKRKTGRPRFVPTDIQRQQVAVLAATQVPHETIAMMIGLIPATLQNAFEPELKSGYERVNAGIKAAVARRALQGETPSVRIWARMFGGEEWRKLDNMYWAGGDQPPIVNMAPGESLVVILPHNGRDIPAEIEGSAEEIELPPNGRANGKTNGHG